METDLRANEPIQTTDNKPTTIDNSYIDNESNGTHNPQLLPRPSPQGSITPSCEENLGPEANAVEIIKGIKAGELSGKELTVDERRLVVKSMKELGQTQDAIADLLKVSRRTIVNDYKALRQQQALAIQNTDTAEIAGEVYDVAKTCIRRALQAGSFRTVSVVMRDMVEVLQSLGILYRAPKTSMQASLHGRLPGHNTGYQKYIDGIGNDKGKVIEVLDCMFDAIDKDSI
jgi:predicted transcriptional regulator